MTSGDEMTEVKVKFLKDKYYYKDGTTSERLDNTKVVHRVDGPAVEFIDGGKIWYFEGERHRLDGPAVEYTYGDTHWYVNGKLHREDGPAIIWPNGHQIWFLDDKELTKEQHTQSLKEIKELPIEIRLTDPREWVRKLKEI